MGYRTTRRQMKKQYPTTQWTVEMRIVRNISVVVEADTELEAKEKVEEWDIIGDEQPGDTIDFDIIAIHR